MINYKELEHSTFMRFKSEADWLKAKEKTIGGSEVAALLNKSNWLTKDDIYNKMVYGKSKKVSENEKMSKGKKAEKHIRTLFTLDNPHYEVINQPTRGNWMFVRKDKPYISCSPDGLFIEKKTKELWGLEIKYIDLIKNDDKELWENDTLPEHYLCQVLQYLIAMPELKGVVLYAHKKYYRFINGAKVPTHTYSEQYPYVVCRDDYLKEIAYIESKETDFYENNVKLRRRPKTVIRF